VLLLDETSAKDKVQWDAAVHNTLATYPIRISVECRATSGDLSALSSYVDQCNIQATLIIAGQFARSGANRSYSEGVAGILLHATQPVARPQDDNQLDGCHVLRPMFSTASEIDTDLHQFASFQLSRNSIQCAWLGALDGETTSMLRLEMGKCLATKETAIRDMGEALGMPGPVSSWLTLALAIEMSLRSGKPQLAAIYDGTSKRSVLCTLQPSMAKD
jgi:hypothetical protein